MIYIIYGDDRVRCQREAQKILGTDYEVLEGSEMAAGDLPSVFLGVSLFAGTRKILIKDLSENKECWEKVASFQQTTHEVVIWEQKIDKRIAAYKALKKAGIDIKEYKLPEKVDKNLAFKVFDMALRDGARAAKMVETVEQTEDPYMLVGAFAWKAIDNYKQRGGEKEKRVLRELSKLDMQMKTSTLQPWQLMKSFLLRVSEL